MKKFLWIPVIFLLCSCGIGRVFVEPTDGDRARIRTVGTSWVYAIPGRRCINLRTPGAGFVEFPYHDRLLGMPPGSTSKERRAEFYVKAGDPITLVMRGPSHYIGDEEVCLNNLSKWEWECDAAGNCGYVYNYDYYDYSGGGSCSFEPKYEHCRTAVTFIPEKDVDYEVVYSEESWSSCKVDVYPIGAHQGEQVNVRTPLCLLLRIGG